VFYGVIDADKLIAVEVPGMDKLHIRKRSVGMLDLGGASLQVAFEVPKSVRFDPKVIVVSLLSIFIFYLFLIINMYLSISFMYILGVYFKWNLTI